MLIIEDGTAKVDAQSYATAAELAAFATARGVQNFPAGEPEQEALLLAAMDYMETLDYQGQRHSYEQNLSWPRDLVQIDGFSLTYSELPRQLQQAQLQLAIDAMTVNLLPNILPQSTGAVLEQTVEGAVSIKYAAPSASPVSILGGAGTTAAGAALTRAGAFLSPLLRPIGRVVVRRG